MAFTYTSAVSSHQLRLLHPVLTSYNVIKFEFHIVSRISKPQYTAISYTWGEDDASDVIYLDDKPFRVRPNLRSCLFFLSRNRPNSLLWADAICINQNDIAERDNQVGVMEKTYREAMTVAVWLGGVPWDSGIKIETCPGLPSPILETDVDWCESIQDLANRPYWSRFWVIQEFLLARNLEIWCGNAMIGEAQFQWLLSTLAASWYNGEEVKDMDPEESSAFQALSLVKSRSPDGNPQFKYLHTLLANHRSHRCKDPRDRVFALLGLVPLEEKNILRLFFPNYAMSEDHVLIITLAYLNQYATILHPLCETVTADCDDVFSGLGVIDRATRQRLLSEAQGLDFVGLLEMRDLGPIVLYELVQQELKKPFEMVRTDGRHRVLNTYEEMIERSVTQYWGAQPRQTRTVISRCLVM